MRRATILAGWGYWDVTHYPHGGCFRRAYKAIPCLVPADKATRLARGNPPEHIVTIAAPDSGCDCGKPHKAAVQPRALQFEE